MSIVGDVGYKKDRQLFEDMINRIIASPYVQNGTVVNWFQAFHSWLHTTSHVDIRYLLGAGKF